MVDEFWINFTQNLYLRYRSKVSRHITDNSFWLIMELLTRSFENFVLRIKKKTFIECFGDSHVRIFQHLNGHNELSNFVFRTISVRGATAFGLDNPNSKTNSFKIFRRWLYRVSRKDFVLFMLGEVDTGFLIWLKAMKSRQDPVVLMNQAFLNYKNFLNEVIIINRNLIVSSAPLPTIKEGQALGEVAILRKEVTVSRKERTAMTVEFNKRLSNWCQSKNILFLNMDLLSLDKRTGEVKDDLLNKDITNHHYSRDAFIKMLVKQFSSESVKKYISKMN